MKTNKLTFFFTYIFWFLISHVVAQDLVFFSNQSDNLDIQNINSEIPLSFSDINGDYRDDIVRIDQQKNIYIEVNSIGENRFNLLSKGKLSSDSWTIATGDLNNSGSSEILTSGNYDGFTLWFTQDQNSSYDSIQLGQKDFFAQGTNFVDIDNDGLLDIFICNDDGLSKIYLNEGGLIFIEESRLIDMRTSTPSDNSGNYSSVWVDIDNDNDLDLYLSKCRFNIVDPMDPRRINALFINEDGNYVESATAFGLDISAQSWSSSFGDIDNDGDFDVFVSNHDDRCMLLENNGDNSFTEINLLEDNTELFTYGLQSDFADFNNDGFLDILITGMEDYLLINNKNKSFTISENPFEIEQVASFALGDANNDGFIDVITSYSELGENNEKTDNLFLNSGNENHFFTLGLNGTSSNKNGIGARIKIFGAWGQQSRFIQSGHGYGISNSLIARFGLDESTVIDTLSIEWPSGIVDKYYDLKVDKHFLATENTCLSELHSISANAFRIDCLNESVEISSNITDPLIWSNGEVTNNIQISEEGFYNYITSENGCLNYSPTVFLSKLKPLQKPEFDIIKDIKLCSPFPIRINTRNREEASWSTGITASEIIAEAMDTIFIVEENECESITSDTLLFEIIDPSGFSGDTIILNESSIIDLSLDYKKVQWYSDPFEPAFYETDTLFNLEVTSDTLLYYSYEVSQCYPIYEGGERIEDVDLSETFDIPGISPFVFFKVFEKSKVKSFNTIPLVEGIRRFEIFNIIQPEPFISKEVYLEEGINLIELDVVLEPGDYFISCNIETNFEQFGTASPQLLTKTFDIQYPYLISDFASILSSQLGESTYPYFFDFTFQTPVEECRSPILPLFIDIDSTNSSVFIIDDYKVFPNPVESILYINSKHTLDQISLYGIMGEKVQSLKPKNNEVTLDLNNTSPGIYILNLKSADKTQTLKIIKN